jgi:hypothetical protein
MPINEAILQKLRNKDSTLTSLNLSCQTPKLTDDDVKSLCTALTGNIYLQNINVTVNNIGAAGAQALASLTSLKTLCLYKGNHIGYDGLDYFLGNTTITEFPITGGDSKKLEPYRKHFKENAKKTKNSAITNEVETLTPTPVMKKEEDAITPPSKLRRIYNLDKQNGWECFDIALGTRRSDLVEFALQHAKEQEYRALLGPEIIAAALIGELAPAEGGLPDDMRTETLKNLVLKYQLAYEEMKGAVEECNKGLGMKEGEFLPLSALQNFFEEQAVKNQLPTVYKKFSEQCQKLFTPHKQSLWDYAQLESTYKKYLEEYYKKKHYAAFLRGVKGEHKNTSIVDVAARMLERKVIVFDTGEGKDQRDVIYETTFNVEGKEPLRIEFNGTNHFVALTYDEPHDSPQKPCQLDKKFDEVAPTNHNKQTKSDNTKGKSVEDKYVDSSDDEHPKTDKFILQKDGTWKVCDTGRIIPATPKDFKYKIKKHGISNSGGKSTENFGRMLDNGDPLEVNLAGDRPEKSVIRKASHQWRWIVAMNRNLVDRRSIEDVVNDCKELLPKEDREKQRLAMVVGNTDLTALDEGYDSDVEEGEQKRRLAARAANSQEKARNLNSHDMAILMLYLNWQANWIDKKTGKQVDIALVKEAYIELSKKSPDQAKLLRKYERSRAKFPFGKARTKLYSSANGFFKKSKWPQTYIHSQDSDYISFNESREFKVGGGAPSTDSLLTKYDKAIKQHRKTHSYFPWFIGGAHVYSQQEDILSLQTDENSLEAWKAWTRFGSELGNAMKALIGQVNPAGLYFHEPNTAILWRPRETPEFGDDSEMLKYVRDSIGLERKRNAWTDCKEARRRLAFDDSLLLSTSQLRSSKPFTVKFNGTFKEGKFHSWKCEDIQALQNMSQEIFTSNEWTNAVASCFKHYKKSSPKKPPKENVQMTEEMKIWSPKAEKPKYDARRPLAQLYNLFDPHFLAWRAENNKLTLKSILKRSICDLTYRPWVLSDLLKPGNYRKHIPDGNKERKAELALVQTELARIYNDNIAEQLVELARQTGELRRSMLNSVLAQVEPKHSLRPKK